MIKVVLHKIIYWSIILITILRASSLFSQVPVISIPQPAEIGRFDNFRQTSPQKPSGISSSRDALIQRQNEATQTRRLYSTISNPRSRNAWRHWQSYDCAGPLFLNLMLPISHLFLPNSSRPLEDYFSVYSAYWSAKAG